MGENSSDEAAEVQAGASNPVPPGVSAMAISAAWMRSIRRKRSG